MNDEEERPDQQNAGFDTLNKTSSRSDG